MNIALEEFYILKIEWILSLHYIYGYICKNSKHKHRNTSPQYEGIFFYSK